MSRRFGTTAKVAAAVGAALTGGAVWLWWRERGAEQPRYETVAEEGAFSIRRYPALLVAETVRSGARGPALNSGFGVLADYIFAETRGGEEIAMTAPVLAKPEDGGGWRVRFVMPAKWTAATLPAPTPGVAIDELAPRTVAAVRFAGRGGDGRLAEREAALRRWLATRGLEADGPVEHAFYNSPFWPPPLRRNEVLLPLAENHTG